MEGRLPDLYELRPESVEMARILGIREKEVECDENTADSRY